MSYLDNLPFELYRYIFDEINIIQLVQLRLVSKKLKLIVDNIGIRKLLITPNNLPIRYEEILKIIDNNFKINLDLENENDLKFFKNNLITNNLFKNLNLLQIDFNFNILNRSISSFHLNKFEKLEELHFICHNDEFNLVNLTLIHQNLKNLTISVYRINLTINCPYLIRLIHDSEFRSCKIIYPNSIKYLSIRNDISFAELELLKLINLEHIVFRLFYGLFELNRLLELSKLKIICLNRIDRSDDYLKTLDDKLNNIKCLFETKMNQQKYDLNLYCNNKILNSINLVNLDKFIDFLA